MLCLLLTKEHLRITWNLDVILPYGFFNHFSSVAALSYTENVEKKFEKVEKNWHIYYTCMLCCSIWPKSGLHLNWIIYTRWSGSVENIHAGFHLIEIILNCETRLFHWKYLCKLLHLVTRIKVIILSPTVLSGIWYSKSHLLMISSDGIICTGQDLAV